MLKEKTKDRAAAYNQFGILYIVVLDILFFFFFFSKMACSTARHLGKDHLKLSYQNR